MFTNFKMFVNFKIFMNVININEAKNAKKKCSQILISAHELKPV